MLLLLCFTGLSAQDEGWIFRKEVEGIKVFTKKSIHSKIKEMRMELEVEASLSTIISLLYDSDSYTDWVFRALDSKTISRSSDYECLYYGSFDFPWPLSDRDVIVHCTLTQDPETNVVEITSVAKADALPVNDDFIRITDHWNRWIFTPMDNGKVSIQYELRSDPAGKIPNWLINWAIDRGPTDTMEAFIKILENDKYRSARLAFITEP